MLIATCPAASHLTVKVALHRIRTAKKNCTRQIDNAIAPKTLRPNAVSLGITLPIVLVSHSSNGPDTKIVSTKIQVRTISRGEVRTPALSSSICVQFPICNDVTTVAVDDLDTAFSTSSLRQSVGLN
jgi:hypothetical protein